MILPNTSGTLLSQSHICYSNTENDMQKNRLCIFLNEYESIVIKYNVMLNTLKHTHTHTHIYI